MASAIWTIGHSSSRRYPHFALRPLEASLVAEGLRYEWLGVELGGRRKRLVAESSNRALRNQSFRNFADFMATPAFEQGIERLLDLAARAPTAVMCAELLWWRCHRSLICDYLTAVCG